MMMTPARILLVEDNPADADLTRETLAESGVPLQVDVVGDGAAALRYLVETIEGGALLPDLVVLDLNLPKLDGRTVLGAVRANPNLRKVPVVVLSSSDAARDISDSYSLGANCYITKPSTLAEFQHAVRSLGRFWLTVVELP